MDSFLPFPEHFGTTANHAGQEPENWESMCVVPPITLSTTFKRSGSTEYKKYEYGRYGNPTRDSFETCLAKLENVDYALCFPSGVAAITALVTTYKSGDHFIISEDLFGGTILVMRHFEHNMGLKVTFTDCMNIENIEKAVTPHTKMIFIETPTNPSGKVLDIRKISEVAKKHNLMFVVDNTFLTPYLQRPMDLGADMCLYSLTKYLNGHTDVIMGGIVMKHKEHYEKLKWIQKSLGLVPSPFDCFLALRGIKTLHVRMRQHSENAFAIAKFLETHPKIEKVCYPSLPSHPQYDLTRKQTSGSSGMLCFYIKGDKEKCAKFMKSLKIITLATSLGGTESLICLPYTMTHPQLTHTEKINMGITESFVRMSIGIEDTSDLIADIKQALDKC